MGDTQPLSEAVSSGESRTPPASSEIVRNNMRRQKRRDTKCELAVRRLLHASGVRYRVDFRPLPDYRFRADIGWKGRKLAVFIDGCFWHGCATHGNIPKSNSLWWVRKFETNEARDRRADDALRAAGWTVIRFWEHERAEDVAAAIIAQLQLQSPQMPAGS